MKKYCVKIRFMATAHCRDKHFLHQFLVVALVGVDLTALLDGCVKHYMTDMAFTLE